MEVVELGVLGHGVVLEDWGMEGLKDCKAS